MVRFSLKKACLKPEEILFGLHICLLLGHRLVKFLEYGPVFLMLFYLVFHLFSKNKGVFKVNNAFIPYLFFSLVFSSFALLSRVWCYSTSAYNDLIPPMLECVFLTVWILYFGGNAKTAKRFLCGFLIGVCYMSVRIILYALFTGQLGYAGTDNITRPATGWQFNMACQIVAFGAIIAFYLFYVERKKIYLIPLPLAAITIYLGGSRKALLMPVLGILLIYLLDADKPQVKRLFKFAVVAILILIAGAFVLSRNEEMYDRLYALFIGMTTGTSPDGSYAVRMFLIEKAKSMFADKPLIGWGMNSFGSYAYGNYGNVDVSGRYAHNNYWELLSCLGIIGMLLYYSKYVYAITKAFKKRKKNPMINLCLVIFLVSVTFEYGIVSYYIVPLQTILTMSFLLLLHNEKGSLEELQV